MTENRRYFRVVYPSFLRPGFETQRGLVVAVVDICEKGLRFVCERMAPPPMDAQVTGLIHFRRGGGVTVKGRVLRVTQHDAAMFLEPGIPLGVILTEQRFLLKALEARGRPGHAPLPMEE